MLFLNPVDQYLAEEVQFRTEPAAGPLPPAGKKHDKWAHRINNWKSEVYFKFIFGLFFTLATFLNGIGSLVEFLAQEDWPGCCISAEYIPKNSIRGDIISIQI